MYFGPEKDPARIVHRGDCRTNHGYARPATTEQARAVLEATTPYPARCADPTGRCAPPRSPGCASVVVQGR